MHPIAKIVKIQEGGFVALSQDDLVRLGARIGDDLDVVESGYREFRLFKAKAPEDVFDITSPL